MKWPKTKTEKLGEREREREREGRKRRDNRTEQGEGEFMKILKGESYAKGHE